MQTNQQPDSSLPQSGDFAGRGWVNVALNRPATQSSDDPDVGPQGATAAVSGVFPDDFAQHTQWEQNPWWQVDLQDTLPLQAICIYNRRDPQWRDRARTLRIEASLDGKNWSLLHAGLCFFSDGADGLGFVLPLSGRVLARYIRLSLEDSRCLHLAQVAVWADSHDIALHGLLRGHGLDSGGLYVMGDPRWFRPRYFLEPSDAPGTDTQTGLVGLDLRRFGRFGNTLIQITHALELARRAGITQVRLPDEPSIRLPHPVVAEGITLLPHNRPFSTPGQVLRGDFFRTNGFSPGSEAAADASRFAVVQRHLRPHLPFVTRSRDDDSGAADLVIHIRSGDIFNKTPHSWYVQPPLAFYRHIIADLRATTRIDHLCVVAEDRRNPCVDGVLDHAREMGLAAHLQSGSFEQDVQRLLRARHLVFGLGTFGVGICLLMPHIETLYYAGFAGAGAPYDSLQHIARLIRVDVGDGYIRPGDWTASAAQRALMLEFPQDGIRTGTVITRR